MVLVCGATGELGGRVVRGLRAAGSPVRALARPRSDTGGLRELGVELTTGDFRDAESLRRAVMGVESVVSTVTVIARALAGEKYADFHAVDGSAIASSSRPRMPPASRASSSSRPRASVSNRWRARH